MSDSHGSQEDSTTVQAWEARYASRDRVWSGRVNPVLEETARTLPAGTALDIGCGEGADVIWLAKHGWSATGLDASKTAIERSTRAAEALGLAPNKARFISSDLTDLGRVLGQEVFDLVTMSFMQTPATLPRTEVLKLAAARVAPGGFLLLTSHAQPPPWSSGRGPRVYPQPEEEELDVRAALPHVQWETLESQVRSRVHAHAGRPPAEMRDTVVLMRQLPS